MSTILFFLPLLVVYTVFVVYAERKVGGFIHDRLGPMEVGKYGLAQTIADLLKLLLKEDITPKAADKWPYKIAPVLIFVVIFAGYSVLPLHPTWTGSPIETGVFFLVAIISLDVIGILMAGWASNSKFSLFGAMRSVAQIVSYEIPLSLSVLCVVMVSQSMDLQEISLQQGVLAGACETCQNTSHTWMGFDSHQVGGFLAWNIFQAPFLILVYLIFFISGLAESNRTPFDLPESESELIGGFHTEYSGFRWSIVMLSEYGMMLLISLLGVVLFLGSWNTPLPNIGSFSFADWTTGTPGTLAASAWGLFWILSKTFIVIFVHIWIRFTYPRLRVDQLMGMGWKYLTPAMLFLIFIAGTWRVLIA